MRHPRIKATGEGFYHVVNRIDGRQFLLDDGEKGILLGMIRAAAAFSGVEICTYAMMDNHFHLLVRIPPCAKVGDRELDDRMRALYGPEGCAKLLTLWAQWRARGEYERVALAKRRLRARMHDLSQFCKTFMNMYMQDYNRRLGHSGSIWAGRYKSLLLEGAYRPLMLVGAYIHLNPVRAGVAEEPEAAWNTGYGAACAGDAEAQRGLVALVERASGRGEGTGPAMGWEEARIALRNAMEGVLDVPDGAADADAVRARGSAQALRELLRHRCAAFLNGGMLGGSGFLQEQAGLLPPRRNKRMAGKLDGQAGLGLATALGVREPV
jgi:hypothetical protein